MAGGDASIQLDLDAQAFFNDLQNLQNKFAQFANAAGVAGEKAKENFNKGSAGFGGALGTNLVQGIAALGIGREIEHIVAKFSEIEDIGRRFGVPVEGLQRIANAAEKLGIPVEGVGKSFRFLELARDKALAGQDEFIQKFHNAGLTMEQVKEIHIEDLFVAVGSKSLTAVDGLKLFGRGFSDVRPLAEGLAQGTVQFGNALNAIDVKKLKEVDDSIKELKQQAEIFGGGLIAGGVKIFQGSIALLIGAGQAGFEELKGLGSGITTILSHTLQGFATEFKAIGAAVSAAAHGHFKEAGEDLKKGGEDAAKIVKAGLADAGQEISKHHALAKDITQAADEVSKEYEKPTKPVEKPRIPRDEEESKETGKARDKAEKEEHQVELGGLSPTDKKAQLIDDAKAKLEEIKTSKADTEERFTLTKEYLDIVKEIRSTQKEIDAEEKRDEAEENKTDRERDKELKKELRERGYGGGGGGGGGGSGGGRRRKGSGRAGGLGPITDATLEQQALIDEARQHDEEDRRAHGTYAGPGGPGGEGAGIGGGGLVSGHVEGAQYKSGLDAFKEKGSGLGKLGSSLDAFHDQFKPKLGSHADDLKKGVDGAKTADKHVDVAKDQLTALQKIEKNTADGGANK
jgi:hypothetical protein